MQSQKSIGMWSDLKLFLLLLVQPCGINYFHKTTPSPTLHRDVSSANFLLNLLSGNQWFPNLSNFGSFNFMRKIRTLNAGNPVYTAPELLIQVKVPIHQIWTLLAFECCCMRRVPTGMFNVSMLHQVNWISLIAACVNHNKQLLDVLVWIK